MAHSADLTKNTVREANGIRLLPAIDPATGRIDPAHVPDLALIDPGYAAIAGALNPAAVISMVSHFVEAPGTAPFADASSNGGNSNFTQQHNEAGHIGVVGLGTGGGTGTGAILSAPDQLYLGYGVTSVDEVFQIPDLSAGGDTFEVRAGFLKDAVAGSAPTAGIPADGLYAHYSDGVNGGRWEFVAVTDGAVTAVDTGVAAVGATWIHTQITVSADGLSAALSLDGGVTVCATIVSPHLPFGRFRVFAAGTVIEKLTGATGRSVLIDYIAVRIALTTPL